MSTLGALSVSVGNTVLADGTDAGGRATLLDASGGPVAQIVDFFRAATVGVFGRGNVRDEFGIRVQQFQESVPDALQRYFTEPASFPVPGVWTIVWNDPTGATLTATVTAAAKVARKQPIGQFTDFTYKLTAQTFTVSTTSVNIINGGNHATAPTFDVLNGGTASFTPADIINGGGAGGLP